MITLTPLAMVVPNSEGIYAVSRLDTAEQISADKFRDYTCRQIQVSFEPDGISNPQSVPAYGYGLKCWYLADFSQW